MANVIRPIQNVLKKASAILPSYTGTPSGTGNRQISSKSNTADQLERQKKADAAAAAADKALKKKKVKNSGAMTLPTTVDRNSVFGNSNGTGVASTFTPPPPPTPPDVIVRIPERDVVNFVDENIPTELITNLLFENLGANELIKFERHDTIEGTNATYDIISNLTGIRKIFDPATLISRQKPNTSFFDIFNIKLEDKIPTDLYLRNNPKIDATGEVNSTDYVYIDPEGNLVIELVNIDSDEVLEVEIDSNGTIYEVTI
jgi:hypothetical protein